MESLVRLNKIADYILAHHSRKTYNQEFTAMFCESSIETLIKYFELFQTKKDAGEHNLRVATIFSYTANVDDKDATGFLYDEPEDEEFNLAADHKSDYQRGNSSAR